MLTTLLGIAIMLGAWIVVPIWRGEVHDWFAIIIDLLWGLAWETLVTRVLL